MVTMNKPEPERGRNNPRFIFLGVAVGGAIILVLKVLDYLGLLK